MPINVRMPAFVSDMGAATIVKWMFNEGDDIKAGDVLAQVSSGSNTGEIKAAAGGTLERIVVPEGANGLKVRDLVAVLAIKTEAGSVAAAPGQRSDAPGGPAPAASSGSKGASDDAVLKLFEGGSYERVPNDGMRRTIARRLVTSKQTIPHFYVAVDCEIDQLLGLRSRLNDAAPRAADGLPVYKLSVNDMVIRALALALRDVPDANVSWTESAILKHQHVDIGVAVSIAGGLITPIIRKAEQKTLQVISAEMNDLGKRARDRKLKPEEYEGGTTSISNMGMMGVKEFAAVINPPHATILAVGAGRQHVVVKSGSMAIATVMSVTLSIDHRCVDGVLGAKLLQIFKSYIENPMSMVA
ncbi:MAG: pyruvate dehydrogenase complex dihydrolipoamide acetyltransferase [Mesorhizobium sp.]|nr:MAG: pyruvate dehydrogenase complex dihydrolipoamide acetyltransferase [Mesorhizobium sp.]RWM11300.1 MAG: pyruvate dehydrogenase complex dihydrolipoamide acetyltransferase [Mesorhizobium sp.]